MIETGENNLGKMKEITKLFENYKPQNKYKGNLIPIFTNGNPYTTLILALFAKSNNINILLDSENCSDEKNAEIVKNFENVKIAKLNSKNLAQHLKSEKKECIWVVDDDGTYDELIRQSYPCKNIKIMSIDLYYDYNYDKFNNIIELIRNYCDLNYIELHEYKGLTVNHIKKRATLKNGSSGFLIFTENEKEFDKIENNNKKIYINYNPFDKFETDMVKEFIKKY